MARNLLYFIVSTYLHKKNINDPTYKPFLDTQ